MDLLFLSSEIATRLQAGAAGSLIAVLTSEAEADASVTKRLFCGWIAAVFCSPVAVSVAEGFLISEKIMQKLDRTDAELVSAFLVGLVGWQGIKWVQQRFKRFTKENG